ncbi:hypothetical protein A3A09_03130 [Candidatus Nomurabacteria bacterium RIFCSPLOWO2_01_FULL_42_20]|uniref:Type II toxin-antitoxin system RelE/ParE family toxin n=1 Tax=Candidatus Nomurabacteria bacterium RIFCSPHIGHO2_01_FULL_42_16 TaxID=1801743 RepID=A0A1F6VJ39_9BACT|nr:MAG: hypothetical protein A2824_03230 [Candidatus Nomurabacteria bacterium RIFCSPHIGHO2_01_FULL_42_16]OGI92598.1 MAG: hypothetical protein A3A09_03130 [Candidatus Nomurabacteria bacterium RIFCSPLOWO2_01_FULL_42_20]
MPSLKKLLSKFDNEEREVIEFLLVKIAALDWRGLDVKKLKGRQDTFRIRKGKIRIIFSKIAKDINIMAIERRSDTTYNS